MLVYKPVKEYSGVDQYGLFDWLFGSKPKATKEGKKGETKTTPPPPQQHSNLTKILLIGGGLLALYFLLKGGKAEQQLKQA